MFVYECLGLVSVFVYKCLGLMSVFVYKCLGELPPHFLEGWFMFGWCVRSLWGWSCCW